MTPPPSVFPNWDLIDGELAFCTGEVTVGKVAVYHSFIYWVHQDFRRVQIEKQLMDPDDIAVTSKRHSQMGSAEVRKLPRNWCLG